MNIVPLTVAVGLCLVFTFVLFFLGERQRGRMSSAEHDSLLPLAEETPHLVSALGPAGRTGADADHPGCDCADGSRPPCPGCLKRPE
jgi:hypothetical protein